MKFIDWLYIEKPDKIFFDNWELLVLKDWKIRSFYNNEIYWTLETWWDLNFSLFKLREISEDEYYIREDKKQKDLQKKKSEQEYKDYLKLKSKYEK